MNPISREPVLIQALATIVVWAATRYGLNISDEQALQIAAGAFVILAPFVRQLVTPTAKVPAAQGNASNSGAQVSYYPTAEGKVDQPPPSRITDQHPPDPSSKT